MISHGYAVKEQDDPIVDIVEAAMSQFSKFVEPGAYLVDMVPLCKPLIPRRPADGGINRISLSLLGRDVPSSAIRARLVPWSWMESEGQAVR